MGKNAALWLRRGAVYGGGLFLIAMGVVCAVRSGLGVSPVASPANIVYEILRDRGLPVRLGQCTAVVYCGYILTEFLLLRRDFRPAMLLQILVSCFFGFLVSGAEALLAPLPAPEGYPARMVWLLASVPLMAAGAMCYLAPEILPAPAEGLTLAISQKSGWTLGGSKVVFDCSCVAVAAALSLGYFHRLVGIREGTVICALTVGTVMKGLMRAFQGPLKRFVGR